jgi:hypothetical protein
MDLAVAGGLTLILYDWDAPTLFGDPLRTSSFSSAWSRSRASVSAPSAFEVAWSAPV